MSVNMCSDGCIGASVHCKGNSDAETLDSLGFTGFKTITTLCNSSCCLVQQIATCCKVARSLAYGVGENLMMVSRPYLTLVAIGLSGIPYTGSPAKTNSQTVIATSAIHDTTRCKAQTAGFATCSGTSARLCVCMCAHISAIQ